MTKQRDVRDFYPTDPAILTAALKELPWKVNCWQAWEPACGSGNLIKPLHDAGCQVVASDLYNYDMDESVPYVLQRGVDFCKVNYPAHEHHFDLLCTNPPYSLAGEFVKRSLYHAHRVMLLLRLSMLGSIERYDNIWSKMPSPDCIMPLMPRPQFVDVCEDCKKQYPVGSRGEMCTNCYGTIRAGSDNAEYAWFVWQAEWDDPLDSIIWIRWR